MSPPALDVSQNIPDVGEEGRRIRWHKIFQLYPSRGFPFAMETQKCPLNPLCAAAEMGEHRAWRRGLATEIISSSKSGALRDDLCKGEV